MYTGTLVVELSKTLGNFPGIDIHIRCHDSNENMSNSHIPRGQSGVAILWSITLSDTISKLDVGNERILAIEIEFDHKICILKPLRNAPLTKLFVPS